MAEQLKWALKMFDNHPDAMVVSRIRDGRIERVNASFLSLFGYDQTEVIGKSSLDLSMIEKIDSQANIDLLKKQGYVRKKNVNIRTKAGEIRNASLTIMEIEDDDDPRMLTIIQDVTEHKQTRKRLAHDQEKIKHLVDNIPLMLVFWNPNLQRFTLNRHAESVLGWTTADANEGDIMSKVFPEPVYRSEIAAFMRSLSPEWREQNMKAKDGSIITTTWTNTRLSDKTMIGIGLDLRERNRVLHALQESDDNRIIGLSMHDDPSIEEASVFIADKMQTPEQAVSIVKSGDSVFIGTACATPVRLIEALEARGSSLYDVKLVHFLTDGAVPMVNGRPKTSFQHKVFFVGEDTREAMKQGMAQYIPISIAQVPRLIMNETIPVNVAFVQVSLPDDNGFVSLGVSVDITRAAVLKAKTVIAEINPNMPYTLGNSLIPVDRINAFVAVDTPVIEYLYKSADSICKQIARYVARIIHNHSTIHIGIGPIPNLMLKHLTNRKNLSIHSDVITESVVDLIAKKVITGPIVTSYCLGTKSLYQLIHKNEQFSFQPIDYICQPEVITAIKRLVSVTQVFCIDLMGQACADQSNGDFYSGLSAQSEFLRAAGISPRGKAIICLSSTTPDGKESRIRPFLKPYEGVTTPRSEVHFVVTEYGIAYLYGKSIQEKALDLIEIAHPDFRPWLLEEAIRLGHIEKGQTLRSRTAYPEIEERKIRLANGRKVMIRPARASDAVGLQDIFYSLGKDDIYTRFFTHLESYTEQKAQHLCNVDYETEMAFVAVIGKERENHKIIGSCCYFVDPMDNLAEVGYMIRPEWQRCGLGTALQKRMLEYAKSKGVRGFKANILAENVKMQRIFTKGENVTQSRFGNEYEYVWLF